MSDGELEKLAEDARSLTETAREILAVEIRRRGLGLSLVDSAAGDQIPAGPIVLRRFAWLPEAIVAGSVLDSAGIECLLPDENTLRMNWFWTIALGHVRIWVRADDVADAAQLLDQDWVGEFAVSDVGLYKQPRCPQCGSFDVSDRELVKRLAGLSLMAFWLFSVVPPIRLRRPGWKCHKCGNAWQEEQSPPAQIS